MRCLLLIVLNGQEYGIWKDEILSIKELQTLHRIPLCPACIAGISIIDNHAVTLADLSVCIGHGSTQENGKQKILLMPAKEKVTGFMVGEIESLSIPPEAVLPMPDYLKTRVIDTCAVQNAAPIPIINISLLYDELLKADEDLNHPAFRVSVDDNPDSNGITSVRIFDVGGAPYALPADGMEAESVNAGSFSNLSHMPQYVKGITLFKDALVPVIDVAQRIKRRKASLQGPMLVAAIGGSAFGLHVDNDRGIITDGNLLIKELPPIAQSPWVSAAVLLQQEIIPLIDPAALLSTNFENNNKKPLSERYVPDSQFHHVFGREDVEVLEFSLLGARHALPKAEVSDVRSFTGFREMEETLPIVIGVAEHEGDLLPVLDPAMIFGRRSPVTPEWSMMLLENGDFRALIITDRVFGERGLPREAQRAVPILLPHNVVYGCYAGEDAVQLILNIEAIAVHFEKSRVRELFPDFSEKMKHAPGVVAPPAPEHETDAFFTAEGEKASVQKSVIPPSFAERAIIQAVPVTIPESFNKPEEAVPIHQEEQEQIKEARNPEEKIVLLSPFADGDASDAQPAVMDAAIGGVDAEEANQEEVISEQAVVQEIATASEESGTIEQEMFNEETVREQAAPQSAYLIEERRVKETGGEEQAAEEVIVQNLPENVIQPEQEAESACLPEPGPEHESEAHPAAPGLDAPTRISKEPLRRRIAYGAMAGVLVAVLVFVFGISRKTGFDKQARETIPAKSEAAIIETQSPRPVKTSQPSLEIELPANKQLVIEVYLVVKGDTLWNISERFTGNPYSYPRIAGENRIADPDLIFPGQTIRLKKKQ